MNLDKFIQKGFSITQFERAGGYQSSFWYPSFLEYTMNMLIELFSWFLKYFKPLIAEVIEIMSKAF